MLYVGLDQHKKHSYCTVKGKEGEEIFKGKVFSTREAMEEFLSSFDEELSVALEAGPSWHWLYDFLEARVAKVELVNPKACKAIASAKLKNDKLDSETLCDLSRANLLPTCYVPSQEQRYFKEIVRQKAFFSAIRTRLKNRIHSVLAKLGTTHNFSDLFGKGGREFLDGLCETLSFPYRDELESMLELLDAVKTQIVRLTKTIDSLCKDDRQAFLIARTIPGIGYYSALLIVSEIGDVRRFANAKKLFSYAGIIPSERSSGERIRRGPITKQGSTWLRWALVEAAQRQEICKRSPFAKDLERIAAKKGRKTATVAVARKILKAIYVLLKENQPETSGDWGGLPIRHSCR